MKFVAIRKRMAFAGRDVMGELQPTIRPGAGSYSRRGIDVHVDEAAMLRHLESRFGASQIMRGTSAFRDHSPAAQVVPVQ